jgi:peptidoglycan/LPS O-acetylase OafA/YrhL
MKERSLSDPRTDEAHLGYRPDIDGLRAIAIVAVVLFHAFPDNFSGGFIGVDVFFVISGFLISSIIFTGLARGRFGFANFYARRIMRLFPALILVLAACLAFGWFALLPDEYKQLGKHVTGGLGFVQNFILWDEVGYFDNASDLKPLRHLWSLGIEEQYYLLYPLLVWAAWRAGLDIFKTIVLIAACSFAVNIFRTGNHDIEAFFLPHTRFWELLAGGMLAYLHVFRQESLASPYRWTFLPSLLSHSSTHDRRAAVRCGVLSIFGFALIVAAVLYLNKSTKFPGWWALMPIIGSWLIISAGPDGWVNRRLLGNSLIVFVGLISYPLYLWDWPLLSLAQIIESDVPIVGIRVGVVVVSFVLASLTFICLERPLRLYRNTFVKTAVLCALAMSLAYIGFNTYASDGLAFRVKDWSTPRAVSVGRPVRKQQLQECIPKF